MNTREAILDAFEALLIDEGERAATMNSITARAGVSKGGLLYHFPDKTALVDGLLDRVWGLAELDFAAMAEDPAGACNYYVRNSVYQATPFGQSFIALSRLRQHTADKVADVFRKIQDRWLGLIRAEVSSEAAARAVLLLGDGLYYNAALASSQTTPARALEGDMDALLAVVDRMKKL